MYQDEIPDPYLESRGDIELEHVLFQNARARDIVALRQFDEVVGVFRKNSKRSDADESEIQEKLTIYIGRHESHMRRGNVILRDIRNGTLLHKVHKFYAVRSFDNYFITLPLFLPLRYGYAPAKYILNYNGVINIKYRSGFVLKRLYVSGMPEFETLQRQDMMSILTEPSLNEYLELPEEVPQIYVEQISDQKWFFRVEDGRIVGFISMEFESTTYKIKQLMK